MRLRDLSEADISRRDFLRRTGGGAVGMLTGIGLSTTAIQQISTAAISADAPKLMLSITAAANSRYNPTVRGSLTQTTSAYNSMRKIIGREAEINANFPGENFELISIIKPEQVQKLLQYAKVESDYSEPGEGVFIELLMPNQLADKGGNQNEIFDVALVSSDSPEWYEHDDLIPNVTPDKLLETWWNNWESWGTEYIDKDTLDILKKNKLNPNRLNVTDPGYNRYDERIEQTGSSEPEEWEQVAPEQPEQITPEQPEQITPRPDDRLASPMHQPFESRLIRALYAIA